MDSNVSTAPATDPAATGTETAAATDTAATGTTTAPAAPANEQKPVYDEAYVTKLNEQHQQEMAKAVEEAIKKSTMPEDEKAAYEAQQREKNLADREAEISKRELKSDAKGLLAENDLSADFLEMVVGKDLKETENNVKALKSVFDTAVQAQVEKKLVGTTPKTGSGVTGATSGSLDAEIDANMD